MLYPLSDLRDPLAFLSGARVPIAFVPFEGEVLKDDTRIEWSADRMFCAGDDGCAQTLWHEIELPLLSFALDLADPDVARWTDRKIAEVVAARILNRRYGPIVSAVLGISRKAWVVTALHEDGRVYPWGFYREEAQALRFVPVAPDNIPTARAALVRALFGKVPA